MPAPTGTLYPGAQDTSTAIGTAVASGGTIANSYANITSSAILAIELALGDNPQGSYGTVALALAGKVDVNTASTMNTTINMNSNRITSLATPTASTDAATKGYVDANSQGLTLKQSVVVMASSNVTLSTGGLLTIDGVTLTSGQRVLCTGQTTASENGIYAAASGAWSRTSDANTSALVPPGMVCFVQSGTNYANQTWALITPGPITLGTTSLTFSQFGATNGANAGANTNITALMDLNGPIQAPTQVNDANGNAVLTFGSTASAVNGIEVTNAATGSGPTIAPAGSDANITLNLNAVGSGVVAINSSTEIFANGTTGLYVKGSSGESILDLRDSSNNEVFLVISGGGQQIKLGVVTSGASYTAGASDYVIVINKVTGSATTVNLPSSPGTGRVLTVKDGKGDAATNNITITPAAGGIDGAGTLVISTNYGVARLIYNGSQWNVL